MARRAPAVERVHHPSLHDPAGLVGRQMSGTGSLLAFEVRGGAPAAAEVAGACELITHAVSLGGVDTLIQHPASLTHRPVEGDAKPCGGLLRVSVGLEDPEDLRADLVGHCRGSDAARPLSRAPSPGHDFGPTCRSRAATASRRATDRELRRFIRQAMPSRSSAC
ncbi:PLP-dependent transferase [Micromonospora sp. BRA006-A]|nr:PLP-dependent transferase [Micromonospora sp. BRA006-A]